MTNEKEIMVLEVVSRDYANAGFWRHSHLPLLQDKLANKQTGRHRRRQPLDYKQRFWMVKKCIKETESC